MKLYAKQSVGANGYLKLVRLKKLTINIKMKVVFNKQRHLLDTNEVAEHLSCFEFFSNKSDFSFSWAHMS